MRKIRTFDAVVRELGGHKDVARICRRPVTAVYNWQSRGFFPTVLIIPITRELAAKGFEPDGKLFRLEQINYVA